MRSRDSRSSVLGLRPAFAGAIAGARSPGPSSRGWWFPLVARPRPARRRPHGRPRSPRPRPPRALEFGGVERVVQVEREAVLEQPHGDARDVPRVVDARVRPALGLVVVAQLRRERRRALSRAAAHAGAAPPPDPRVAWWCAARIRGRDHASRAAAGARSVSRNARRSKARRSPSRERRGSAAPSAAASAAAPSAPSSAPPSPPPPRPADRRRGGEPRSRGKASSARARRRRRGRVDGRLRVPVRRVQKGERLAARRGGRTRGTRRSPRARVSASTTGNSMISCAKRLRASHVAASSTPSTSNAGGRGAASAARARARRAHADGRKQRASRRTRRRARARGRGAPPGPRPRGSRPPSRRRRRVPRASPLAARASKQRVGRRVRVERIAARSAPAATRPQRGDAQRARRVASTKHGHASFSVGRARPQSNSKALAEGVPAHLAQAFDQRDSECGSRWRRLAAQKIRASPAMPGIVRALGLCALLADRGAAKVIKGQLDMIESWTYIDRFAFLAMPEEFTGAGAEDLDKDNKYGARVRGARPFGACRSPARPRSRVDRRARGRLSARAVRVPVRHLPTLSGAHALVRAGGARPTTARARLTYTSAYAARAGWKQWGGRAQRA